MQRPGPLQELPLAPFLNPNPPTKPIKANKRPFSPGGPTPFSPAKRRILNEEGIFSSEQTRKSPFPSFKEKSDSPARFSHVLAGPASPARVLDFGPKKIHGGDPEKRMASHMLEFNAIPSQAESSSSRLAPSPELKARHVRQVEPQDLMDTSTLDDDPFEFSALNSPSVTRSIDTPTFRAIPRELPPQSLPHSSHYPGFTVYQDPYVVAYSPNNSDESLSDIEVDIEIQKENLPPRRRIRKCATVANGSPAPKSIISTPEAASPKKMHSTNDTPRMLIGRSGPDFTTPPSTKFNRMAGKLSLGSAPQKGRRSLRQVMKDELDLGEDHNSSEE